MSWCWSRDSPIFPPVGIVVLSPSCFALEAVASFSPLVCPHDAIYHSLVVHDPSPPKRRSLHRGCKAGRSFCFKRWFISRIFLSTQAFYDGGFFSGMLVQLGLSTEASRSHDTVSGKFRCCVGGIGKTSPRVRRLSLFGYMRNLL